MSAPERELATDRCQIGMQGGVDAGDILQALPIHIALQPRKGFGVRFEGDYPPVGEGRGKGHRKPPFAGPKIDAEPGSGKDTRGQETLVTLGQLAQATIILDLVLAGFQPDPGTEGHDVQALPILGMDLGSGGHAITSFA